MLALAVVPLFVAAGVQAHNGWRPVSDDAAIATLAHDVLSTRTPLVGMPSTIGQDAAGSVAANDYAHHPGPMEFWALAVPERLARSAPIGILLGTALVNGAALVIVGLVMMRLLGPRAAVCTLALAEVLVWALGRQWLVDPWNPYIALLPVLALCALASAAVAGRSRALIGVAIVGSFVSQTHLIYAPLAAALFVAAAAGVAYTFWRAARRGTPWHREALITAGGTVGALAIAWALPLYDQFAHSPGNFSEIARSLSEPQGPLVGVDWTFRLDVQAVGFPPLFARQGGGIALISRTWSSLGPLRVMSAIVVVLALVVTLVFAVRRRDRIAASVGAIALMALAVATVVVSRLPGYFDGAPFYRILQMWPVSCFVWIALAVNMVRALTPRIGRRLGARLEWVRRAAFAAAVVLLVIAPVAVAFADSARHDNGLAADAVGRLAAQLEPRLVRGVPYQVDLRSNEIFTGGAVENGLFRELARRGFDTRVDPSDVYLGRAHAAPADAAHLVVVAGRHVDSPVGPGVERLASVDFASTADVARMLRIDAELHDYLSEPQNLTRRGRALLERGSSEPDALVLRRLLDVRDDSLQRRNDGLIARANNLVRTDDHVFQRLVVASSDAQDLVDLYVFKVYLVP